IDIADTSAEIDWNPISADTAWYVELVNLSAGGSVTGDATDSTTSHPFTFTGLDQNTQYLVLVKAHCDTNWSLPFTFTTLMSHDIEVSNFVTPASNACMLTSTEEVIVTLTNNGAQPATGFDIQYSFDGVSYTSDGAFAGTLSSGTDTAYSLSTMFDFSSADDTTLFIAISYAVDTINNMNDTNSISITNLGDQLLQLEVTPSAFANEMSWNVIDTATSTTVASTSTFTYISNGPSLTHDVCVYSGKTYKMEAWDSFGDGWNGGVYEITQCGGVLVANNGGLSPSTLPNNGGTSLESFEYFTVEECDDYDLGIISMDSINSSCGLTASEQGYLLVQNYGVMDITPAMNVSVQYQINGAGWSTLASLPNFASGADTLLAMPTTDMSTPLTYSFEFMVVYALDENASNDSLELDIESVDTYTEIVPAQDFEDAASGWTVHIDNGAIPSWEWGEPTTPMIGSGNNDGKAWVTRLNDNMYLNEESYILSPCFDFSGYTNDAEVQFDFIWTTPSSNRVRLQVSTDGGATWPSIFTTNAESILMPQNTTEWTNRIELFDLAGEGDVKFRFYIDNSFSVDAEGFGMDNFTVFEHVPYTDTTLSALFVEGDTIDGFDPSIFDYNYVYPYGDTNVSNYTISAIVNAPFFESMVITQPTSLPGTGTVVVTAEDTNYTGTYTINFIEADPSTNAYLSDLSSGGSPVDGFDSLVMVYYDTVPFGTTLPIAIDAEVADPTATYTVDYATTLPGATTVTVTAQDGVTTNSYVINYYETPADTNSALINIQVGSVDVAGFHTDTLDYTVEISMASSVVGFASSSDATVTYSPVGGPYNAGDVVTITVTAQDGSTTVYTVTLVAPLSDNNYLSDISVNGDPITGFDSTTLEYTVMVPFGTDLSTLDVTYITSDAGASATDALSGTTPPATTTIVVTAADGSTRTYVITWEYEPASSDCSLLDLEINYGDLYHASSYTNPGFDPGVNDYVAWFDDTEASVFSSATWTITATPQDPTSTVSISPITALSNTVTITVTAQDGSECIYTIFLVDGTGTNELEAGAVSIYPNPSNGLVNVSVVESIENYSVEVYTPNGQKVFTNNFSNENAKLDLSAYADGIYYVTVTDVKTGKSLREKITILK
ncbi:MAG: T9SS type A sorting domain-containing protein, partial [Flavobacteriales bacterium]